MTTLYNDNNNDNNNDNKDNNDKHQYLPAAAAATGGHCKLWVGNVRSTFGRIGTVRKGLQSGSTQPFECPLLHRMTFNDSNDSYDSNDSNDSNDSKM